MCIQYACAKMKKSHVKFLLSQVFTLGGLAMAIPVTYMKQIMQFNNFLTIFSYNAQSVVHECHDWCEYKCGA